MKQTKKILKMGLTSKQMVQVVHLLRDSNDEQLYMIDAMVRALLTGAIKRCEVPR